MLPLLALLAAPPVAAAPEPPPPGAVVRLGTTQFRTGGWRTRVYFTADGNTLVSAGMGRVVVLWDPLTGRKTGEIDVPRSSFEGADFHHGTNRLALIGRDRLNPDSFDTELTVWLVDPVRREVVRTLRLGDGNRSNHFRVAFTPDGKRLLTATDGDLRVWDVATGDELLRQAVKTGVDAFALSADGKTVAFGRYDLYLWDWEAGEEPRKLTRFGGAGVDYVAFAPDGKTLLVYDDRPLKVIDVATGRTVGRRDILGGPARLAFSPDGKTLAVGYSWSSTGREPIARTVTLWDAGNGTEVGRLPTDRGIAQFVSWSADGTRLAGATDHRLWAWDVKSGRPLAPSAPGHDATVTDLAFAPDGRLFTASDDGTVRSWDPATGAMGLTLEHAEIVRGLAVSPDGSLVAGSALADDLRLWDAATGALRFKLLGNGRMGGYRRVAFTPDGKRLVAWGDDLYLRTWDVRTGKLVAEHRTVPVGKDPDNLDPERDFISGITALSADGSRFALTTHKVVQVWDSATGEQFPAFQPTPDGVHLLAFSPDGKRLAVGGGPKATQIKLPGGGFRFEVADDRPLLLLDLATGNPVWQVAADGSHGARLLFSPDGTRLAEVSQDRGQKHEVLRLRDAGTGAVVGRLDLPDFYAHLAFDRTGKRLAATRRDTTVTVYDLEASLKK